MNVVFFILLLLFFTNCCKAQRLIRRSLDAEVKYIIEFERNEIRKKTFFFLDVSIIFWWNFDVNAV